jgi:hypothetical protein
MVEVLVGDALLKHHQGQKFLLVTLRLNTNKGRTVNVKLTLFNRLKKAT